MNTLTMAKIPCTNVISNQTICSKGFEPMSGNCYKALNISYNYWIASTSACSDYSATLVDFDNDTEVTGLQTLISKGINTKLKISVS